ncbi:MAG TPA: glycosyl hydrolase family 5 [Polyangia bacterium]|jgi:hypothetical protein
MPLNTPGLGLIALAALASPLAADEAATATPSARPTSDPGPLRDSAGWTIECGADGAGRLRYAFADVLTFQYLFWGQGWRWVGVDARPAVAPPGALAAFTLTVADLGVTIDLQVRPSDAQTLVYSYSIKATRPLHDIIGGAIEFHLALDAPAFSQGSPPEIATDARAFSWTARKNQTVRVAFDHRPEQLVFERGNKNQIRAFLLGSDVQPGQRQFTMTVRAPDGAVRRLTDDQRYGAARGPDWHGPTLEWDRWPVDVSFLSDGDRPAGRHGRVHAQGDRLVFADGTEARFWGTNVQAYALFYGSKDAVANQARRIAALGYNLVRIHHHDSAWVSPNVFAAGQTTQQLDDAALDRLDWWINCLRREGVYVWLDLHVGRTFRVGDGIGGFDEVAKSEPTGRGFDYVNPRLEQLEQEFARQYLGRVNRYTGVAIADDPAVLGVLVTNEDDLTSHFGNLMLADKGNPAHQKMFEALAATTAQTLHISASDALRTWEPGPAKMVLADLEARFYRRATANLRQLGFQGLVAGTSYWGDEDLASVASLRIGDVIDVHAYGNPETLGTNPHMEANFISYIAAASVGKPVFISEWNVGYPARDRFVAPLYVASIASLQGWDAPMIYGYSQQSVETPEHPDGWSTGPDPALTALMPAAAVMYRQRHVREAIKTYRLELDRQQLFFQSTGPRSSAAIRTLAEQSRLTVGLPDWPVAGGSQPTADATVVHDPTQDFLAADATSVTSDTGELRRDWAQGTQTIDTTRTQAAAGWIGGSTINLHDVRFQIRTPKATVAVTSLDGKPISQSRRMLVTVVGQVVASPGDKMPLLAQPIAGTITLRTARPLRATALSPRAWPIERNEHGSPSAGAWQKPLPRHDSESTFEIPSELVTHWFLLTPQQ